MTAIALLAALFAAQAQELPLESPPPGDPGAEVDLVAGPLGGEGADERLIEIRARLREDDLEGARILAEQLRAAPGPHQEEATYLLGVAWELDEEPAMAIPLYEEALERWPDGARARDLRLRLAEANGTLGRYGDALALLRELGPVSAMPPLDAHKVELVAGIWLLRSGRVREGRARLADVLARVGAEELTFYQAKARAALAASAVEEARGISLDGRGRRQARAVEERARLVAAAEEQVVAVARLREPEWVLEGMLQLGRGYAELADALDASRRPRGLSPEQADRYEVALAEKTAVLRRKAANHWDFALDFATRVGWTSSRVDALREARAALPPVAPPG